MDSEPISKVSGRDCFSGEVNMNLLFNSNIVNSLLKTDGREREKRSNFDVFIAWSA